MTLQVLICTFGSEGLNRVAAMHLPHVKDVSYLVCVQNPEHTALETPSELCREDVKVLDHPTRGLSINRNFAFDHATGDVLLIADDDLVYSAQGLTAVLEVFRRDPQLDFATFRYTGADCKVYPDQMFTFTLRYPKGFYVTSFEIAVRRASLSTEVRFSPDFGIGAPRFGAGEEDLFLRSMIRHNLHGEFFPIDIVEHPGLTTGNRPPSAAVLRAHGAILRIHYGPVMGLLHILREIPRRNVSPITALKEMLNGFYQVADLQCYPKNL